MWQLCCIATWGHLPLRLLFSTLITRLTKFRRSVAESTTSQHACRLCSQWQFVCSGHVTSSVQSSTSYTANMLPHYLVKFCCLTVFSVHSSRQSTIDIGKLDGESRSKESIVCRLLTYCDNGQVCCRFITSAVSICQVWFSYRLGMILLCWQQTLKIL